MPRLVASLLLSALAACGGQAQEGVLFYRARLPDGGVPDARLLARVATKLEVRLLEAGVERNDVGAIPPDTLRVVLPESIVGRIPELRKLLEDPAEMPVVLTFERQGQ